MTLIYLTIALLLDFAAKYKFSSFVMKDLGAWHYIILIIAMLIDIIWLVSTKEKE